MFLPTHMAAGALSEAVAKRKAPAAVLALLSHAVLDMTIIWHAPYPWPEDTPAILQVLPYPHDAASIIVLVTLAVATIAVGFLLRRYWWGMLWGVLPDAVDWLVLRPLTGHHPVHDFINRVKCPWGFAVEVAFLALLLLVILKRKQVLAFLVRLTDRKQA